MRAALWVLIAALAAPAHADPPATPTQRFLALSGAAAGGSRAARFAAALLLADCGRYEEAVRWLDDAGALTADESALRRWLGALCGKPARAVAAVPATTAAAEIDLAAVRARLEWEVPALEALAAQRAPGRVLVAEGAPELISGRERDGPGLVRFWGRDGGCATALFDRGRLVPCASAELEVRVDGARCELAGAKTGAWLVLELAESVPLAVEVSGGRLVRFASPGLIAVEPHGGPLVLTVRPAREAQCGELVTGLAPVPAGPGLILHIGGKLADGPGLALGSLPVVATAPDAPLLGRAAGVRALASGVYGCPQHARAAGIVGTMARVLGAAARTLGAPGPADAPRIVLTAGTSGQESGFSRGELIALALPEQPAHLVPLLAHEVAHASLAGGRRGWPGEDPEEGVVTFLALAYARTAGMGEVAEQLAALVRQRVAAADPMHQLPLVRGLALEHLPRPFAFERPGQELAGDLLANRLIALDRRLAASGRGERLARALLAILGKPGPPIAFTPLVDALERELGQAVPELRDMLPR